MRSQYAMRLGARLGALTLLIGACVAAPDASNQTEPTQPASTTSPSITLASSALEFDGSETVGVQGFDPSVIPSDVVRIEVGTDVQALVDESPPGTAFVFEAGRHTGVEVRNLKDGNEFYGEPGAVLDGVNELLFAIVSYNEPAVRDVRIEGLVFDRYAPPAQLGVIGGGFGIDWVIRHNEVRESAAAGIEIGDGGQVIANHLHHNRQLGVKTGTPTTGVLVQGNEIAFNNYLNEYDMAWEAGGSKFVKSTDLTLKENFVHNNRGVGLWTDGDNIGTVFERNIIVDNAGPGILHEISYDAVIRDNRIENNAFDFYVGGILISNSPGVSVHGNTVAGNYGGINAIQDDRGSGILGPYVVDRLEVRNNQVSISDGWTGVDSNTTEIDVYSNQIAYEGNDYTVPEGAELWRWNNQSLLLADWVAAGFD